MAARIPMRLRALSLLILLPALCGCAGDSSDYGRLSNMIYNQVVGADDSVPRDKAAAVPYATIGVQIGGGPQSMLVLATSTGAERMWLAGTDVAITTREGRVVQTVGLPQNLNGIQLLSDTPVTGEYKYDLANPMRYGVFVRCTKREIGPETIEILGSKIQTRHIAEDCYAPGIGWSFTNEFWRDPKTDYAWKSVQNVNPDGDEIEIDVFRPEDVE